MLNIKKFQITKNHSVKFILPSDELTDKMKEMENRTYGSVREFLSQFIYLRDYKKSTIQFLNGSEIHPEVKELLCKVNLDNKLADTVNNGLLNLHMYDILIDLRYFDISVIIHVLADPALVNVKDMEWLIDFKELVIFDRQAGLELEDIGKIKYSDFEVSRSYCDLIFTRTDYQAFPNFKAGVREYGPDGLYLDIGSDPDSQKKIKDFAKRMFKRYTDPKFHEKLLYSVVDPRQGNKLKMFHTLTMVDKIKPRLTTIVDGSWNVYLTLHDNLN